jgi:hypothetical protein
MRIRKEGARRTTPQVPLFLGVVCAAFLLAASHIYAADVSMGLQDLGQGTYRLEGQLIVQAPVETAWDVLTDYAHITDFVPTLRRSVILDQRGSRVLLQQEAVGKALFFSKKIRVLLSIQEEPRVRILFKDVSLQDFASYEGSWEIQDTTPTLHLIYRLECQRRFAVPNFIAKDVFRHNAERLLEDVRLEILRRHERKTS